MVEYFFNAILISAIFLFGCVGEIITEKSGHLNLGTPGIMCIGAAGGVLGVVIANNANGFLTVFLAIIFAMLFACLGGLIYAFLTVSLRCNQNVTGLALTIFGNGFATIFCNNVLKVGSFDTTSAGKAFLAYLPIADKLGGFGTLVFGHGVLVYISIIVAIVAWFVLSKTRIGLNLRAVGESPATADAAGINVTKYKYVFILIGSAIAGLGGLMYPMQLMAGIIGSTMASTIEGIGWLCVALVILTMWKPLLAIPGAFVFGALYIFPQFLTAFFGANVAFKPYQKILFRFIPYVATIIVLIFNSIRGKKENLGPSGLGVSYFREDR